MPEEIVDQSLFIRLRVPCPVRGWRYDLDVWIYIKDVLDQLLAGSTDDHSLLPDVWKQTHPDAVREYRVEERRDKDKCKQFAAATSRLVARDQR